MSTPPSLLLAPMSAFVDELNAFLPQKIHPPIHGLLGELHVGNPVHEEPSHAIGSLVDGHLVSPVVRRSLAPDQAAAARGTT